MMQSRSEGAFDAESILAVVSSGAPARRARAIRSTYFEGIEDTEYTLNQLTGTEYNYRVKAVSKEGKTYTADYVLDDTGKYVNFKRVQQEHKKIGTCPRCHERAVLEGNQSYYCESGRDACGFTLWKDDKYNNITITPDDAAKLINGESITKEYDTVNGKSTKTYKMVDTGTYVNLKEVE